MVASEVRQSNWPFFGKTMNSRQTLYPIWKCKNYYWAQFLDFQMEYRVWREPMIFPKKRPIGPTNLWSRQSIRQSRLIRIWLVWPNMRVQPKSRWQITSNHRYPTILKIWGPIFRRTLRNFDFFQPKFNSSW